MLLRLPLVSVRCGVHQNTLRAWNTWSQSDPEQPKSAITTVINYSLIIPSSICIHVTHIYHIYIYAKIFWALILMLVQCQHKHALYFHSRLRVQKSIEMAAVYIHTYKLVCMLPQLYRYLVNIRTYIFDISIANYHISLQPLYKPSIGPKKLILPSACVLISELPCSTWKVSDIKRPSASVLLASCMSDVWTVDVWHRSQGNH